MSSISEAELVSRWQSISESQVAAALRVAGRLGHMGSRFDSATKPLEFQLSSWCTTFDLWSAGLVGKDVNDEAVLKKIVGRGLPAEYVSGFVPRVRRSSHGDIKVPGGLNAPARAAATVANIAKKIAAQPSCQQWQSALREFLGSSECVINHFWDSLSPCQEATFLTSAHRALQAAQGRGPPWQIQSFLSLAQSLERKHTLSSLKEGQAEWKRWAVDSLLKGARAAHRFSTFDQKPFIHPRQASCGGFGPSDIANDAAAQWRQVWQADHLDRIREAQQTVEDFKREIIASGESERAARMITLSSVRAASKCFSKSTSLGADGVEFWVLPLLPDAILLPLVNLLKACVAKAQWASQILTNWLCLLPKKQGGFRCIAVMCSCIRIVMRILCWEVRDWDESNATVGDSAAPGKSLRISGDQVPGVGDSLSPEQTQCANILGYGSVL